MGDPRSFICADPNPVSAVPSRDRKNPIEARAAAPVSRLAARLCLLGLLWAVSAWNAVSLAAGPAEPREALWVTDGAVRALVLDPGRGVLYIGGDFTAVGPADPAQGPAQPRRHLAAIDLQSGAPTEWDPAPDGAVHALWLSPDGATLYLGGDFTAVGGQFRERLAAVDAALGLPRAWNPRADGLVRVMVPSTADGASLFVGGAFSRIANAERAGIAELGLLGVGALTGLGQEPLFEPGAEVHALAVGARRLYVGGDFVPSEGDGEEDEETGEEEEPEAGMRHLVAVDLLDFSLLDWAPPVAGGTVRVLHHFTDQDRIYAGGDFTTVAGAAQRGIAAFDIDSAEPLVWHPRLEGAVDAIAVAFDRTAIYLGGRFDRVAGVGRANLAAVGVVDATPLDAWQAATDGAVRALALFDDAEAEEYLLYAGGEFNLVDGTPRPGLAAFAIFAPESEPPLTQAFPPGGFFNASNTAPIVLSCDDGAGSGCAATYYTIDGSEPDTGSARYVAPISVVADIELRFFSVDHAGNAEPVRREDYTFEIGAPVTTASPPSRIFEGRTLMVTLDCVDAGLGCAATYYTVDGSLPDTGSTRYTGPIAISDTTVLQYFSVDVVGNAEGVVRSEYVRNRGEAGALAWFEMLPLLAVFRLRRRRGGVRA
jgi:hypothetical protein